MTLQQLEYIVAVDKTRHFGRAAEQCGVTQPTLSTMIQKIEDELGVKLFDRSVQPVAVTAIGRPVIDQAERVLAEAKTIRDIVAEQEQSLAGTFRIGILPTIAPYLLPRFFPRLTCEHNEIDLHIIEMKTAEIRSALRQGTIDAAILVNVDGMDDYRCTTLFYEQFMVYVSPNDELMDKHAIRAADLNGKFLWLLDETHCFSQQMMKFCEIESARAGKDTYMLGSIETFMRMVENGKGITFIPELSLEQLSEEQRRMVRPFAIPIPVREVVMMTARTFARHSVHDLIVECIRQCVPQNMLTMNNTEQRA